MKKVTADQATETYKRTVRDEPRYSWPTWIVAVSNSLAAGEWIGYDGCPSFAKEVFDYMNANKSISMADEKDMPITNLSIRINLIHTP